MSDREQYLRGEGCLDEQLTRFDQVFEESRKPGGNNASLNDDEAAFVYKQGKYFTGHSGWEGFEGLTQRQINEKLGFDHNDLSAAEEKLDVSYQRHTGLIGRAARLIDKAKRGTRQ